MRRWRNRLWLPALLVVLAPLAVVGLVRADSSCARHENIDVTAAPSVAPALSKAGSAWAGRAKPDGACASVHVTSRSGAGSADALGAAGATPPDVWVPDSSQWVQQLRRDTSGENTPVQSAWVSRSIASSPLVVAVRPRDAASLGKVAAGGWSALLSGRGRFAVTDPQTSTDGLLTLATAQLTRGSASGAPTRGLVSSIVGLSGSMVKSGSTGMAEVRSTSSLPLATSEQAVVQANPGRGPVKVQSVYPRGRGMALDFPVVQFAPPTQEPGHRDAVQAFVASLYRPAAQRALRAAGLRDAVGDAFPTTVGFQGIAATAVVRSLPRASDEQIVDALRVWSAAQRENRTLMVVDVSGSMADGGGDKIRFAAAAAADAVGYLPDTAQLGLWAFSTDLNGQLPWRSLVSLGTVGSPDDKDARRKALRDQTGGLEGLTKSRGDTGLYRTTWDAFQAVRKHYDPHRYNSVVLVTDGANTTSGLSLSDLLSRLKAAKSTSRPLPVFTIAIGPDADRATLKQISAATGGSEYTVATASDIRDVFVDTVVEAGT